MDIQAKIDGLMAERSVIIKQLQEINNQSNQLQVQLHTLNGGITELRKLIQDTPQESNNG